MTAISIMIGKTLAFLRAHINEVLRAASEGVYDESSAVEAVFLDGDKVDPVSFRLGAITLLLINLEEERALRAADPYVRPAGEGKLQRVQPDIRVNLNLLLVARFKQYDQGWEYLSKVIQHFQSVRALDAQTAPGIPDGVTKLVFELVTLGLAEQHEIWSSLHIAHIPSILYRIKMIAFHDRQGIQTERVTESVPHIETRTR